MHDSPLNLPTRPPASADDAQRGDDHARASARASASASAAHSPARVLFVDHTASLGGGEIALLNLVQHLDRDCYHPVVLLFSEGSLADKLREAGVECHVLPLDAGVLNTRKDSIGVGTLLRLTTVFRVMAHVFRVARFIRRQDVALVHANSLKSDIIAGLAARLARRPSIWHVRDRIEPDYLPRAVVAAFRLISRVVPTYVVANSEATLATLHFPGRDATATVYSGVDLTPRARIVHDGTHAGVAPADHASPGETTAPLIGMVGRISPWKGQHVFLRAAADVHARCPEARFQIIGSALFAEQEYEREVRALCTRLGLDSVVEFTGFRSDVPTLIGKLDVLVHASTTGEPFGQVVIEGMAAAKPVVATNGGGVPEIVRDGQTGLLVPMGDADAMGAAIRRLLDDPSLRRRMGQLGRLRVLERFTIRHTAEGVQSVYDEIIGANGPARPGALRLARQVLIAACVPLGLAVLALAVTLAIVGHFHRSEPGPMAAFLCAVVVSAALGGTPAGLLATALNVLLIGYFMLPPPGFSLAPEHRPRLWLFIGTSILSSALVGQLRAALVRHRNGHERARAAQQRAEFVRAAAEALAECDDEQGLFSELCRLASSSVADWSAAYVVNPDGSTERVAAGHRTSNSRDFGDLLPRGWQSLDSVPPIARAVRSGMPQAASPTWARQLLRIGSTSVGATPPPPPPPPRARARACVVVPVGNGEQVQGVLVLVQDQTSHHGFTADHVTLASELAARAAHALERLQRPAPPAPAR